MDDFKLKYYQWCREQASREASAGFSSVAAVRGSLALKSVRALLAFPKDVREELALALVARWHRQQLDIEQQRLLAAFDSVRFSGEQPVPKQSRELANRRKLRSLLLQSAPVLGKQTDNGNPSEMWFEYECEKCIVTTFVDLGGKARQLEYHQLLRLRGDSRPIQEAINLMAWLGLASVTKWDLLASGEEEDAVLLLGAFCKRFIEAIPALV